ncbi:hypothetical protein HPB52_009855 [Rhipicephalus sanguineus]|uniref:Uncharacterized protein n=1 Tax=Rhipicephalus sanguineus TaxID=34632 RepID=A0A9D4PJ31_RHISA|nr:hypothetical protein HPB52_009855 [Rhipicephalus sanguineus]
MLVTNPCNYPIELLRGATDAPGLSNRLGLCRDARQFQDTPASCSMSEGKGRPAPGATPEVDVDVEAGRSLGAAAPVGRVPDVTKRAPRAGDRDDSVDGKRPMTQDGTSFRGRASRRRYSSPAILAPPPSRPGRASGVATTDDRALGRWQLGPAPPAKGDNSQLSTPDPCDTGMVPVPSKGGGGSGSALQGEEEEELQERSLCACLLSLLQEPPPPPWSEWLGSVARPHMSSSESTNRECVATASLKKFMAAEDTFIEDPPVSSGSASRGKAEVIDAPSEDAASISPSGHLA